MSRLCCKELTSIFNGYERVPAPPRDMLATRHSTIRRVVFRALTIRKEPQGCPHLAFLDSQLTARTELLLAAFSYSLRNRLGIVKGYNDQY